MHDYLIVGAGLFGSVFARQKAEQGKTSLVMEKRSHIGGNVYTEEIEGIHVHQYGPHLFHTNDEKVWNWVNKFTKFNGYRHKVKAKYQNEIYSMPINMNTFNKLWGCVTPEGARREVESKRVKINNPANLEEWVLSEVGEEIYEKLIYGYTKKQWNRDPKELPASIIKRLPLRFTYNDDYHNDRYQGVPVDGFTKMVENILDHKNIKVKLNTPFVPQENHQKWAKNLVFSGCVDQFFGYKFGPLEYRSLRFETKIQNGDFQGTGQINYTAEDVSFTRIIEHKHFAFQDSTKTVLTYEYPDDWEQGKPPYIPINDDKNNALYQRYKAEASKLENVTFGGRLGTYKYLDMHQVIGQALMKAKD